jgi:hypothetical protein
MKGFPPRLQVSADLNRVLGTCFAVPASICYSKIGQEQSASVWLCIPVNSLPSVTVAVRDHLENGDVWASLRADLSKDTRPKWAVQLGQDALLLEGRRRAPPAGGVIVPHLPKSKPFGHSGRVTPVKSTARPVHTFSWAA